jgi:DNA-directed RNA polymerase III subunit RPC6
MGSPYQIPAFGTSMWDADAVDDGESQDESERRSKKKRKHGLFSDGDDDSSMRKRSKPGSDENEDSGSDDASSKKSKRKRTKSAADSDDNSDHARKRKRKKRKDRESESEGGSSSEDEEIVNKEIVNKKLKKRKLKRETASSDGEESLSDHSEHRSRRGKSSKVVKRRSPSPFQSFGDLDGGGGYVYRAIKPEHISLGWSESPCSQCPSFDFCKDGGPVNPRECVYYGDWLAGGTAASIEDVR